MFDYNENYLDQGVVTGGGHINESGTFEMTITDAYLLKMQNSCSEALVLELEDLEEKKAKINIWYKNRNGEKVEFQEKHISHLMYLLNINPKSIRTVLSKEKNREEIVSFKEKIIGVILQFDGTEEYEGSDGKEYTRYNYTLKGFYDVSTKRTAEEKKNNKEAKSYDYWFNRFEKENQKNEKKENKESNNYGINENGFIDNVIEEDNMDDFPF